MEVTVMP
jgi:phosphoribosylaminoimidazole-succinocarboxamide synthase